VGLSPEVISILLAPLVSKYGHQRIDADPTSYKQHVVARSVCVVEVASHPNIYAAPNLALKTNVAQNNCCK